MKVPQQRVKPCEHEWRAMATFIGEHGLHSIDINKPVSYEIYCYRCGENYKGPMPN